MKKSCISGGSRRNNNPRRRGDPAGRRARGLVHAHRVRATESINAYTFQSSDPLIYARRAGLSRPGEWGGSGYDFGTGGCEYYNLFFSDSLGNALALGPSDALPAPAYFTIVCMDYSCNPERSSRRRTG